MCDSGQSSESGDSTQCCWEIYLHHFGFVSAREAFLYPTKCLLHSLEKTNGVVEEDFSIYYRRRWDALLEWDKVQVLQEVEMVTRRQLLFSLNVKHCGTITNGLKTRT